MPGRLATQAMIDLTSTGQRYELEATMVRSGFDEDLLAESGPSATSP